jgi:hypothetical protein
VHVELLETARKLLCAVTDQPPTRTDLRRAVSTAYYALFHFVSFSCVNDMLGGGTKNLGRAKLQAYRSLEHRDVLTACEMAKIPKYDFPQQIKTFAAVFIDMQKRRAKADYSPEDADDFKLPHVEHLIGECEAAISLYQSVDLDDRKAFAVLVTMKSRAR